MPLDFKGLNMLHTGENSSTKQLYVALRNVLEFPPSSAMNISDEEMLASILTEFS